MSVRDQWRSDREVRQREVHSSRSWEELASRRAADRMTQVTDVAKGLGDAVLHTAAIAGTAYLAWRGFRSDMFKSGRKSIREFLKGKMATEGASRTSLLERLKVGVFGEEVPKALAQGGARARREIINPSLLHDLEQSQKLFGQFSRVRGGEGVAIEALMTRYGQAPAVSEIPAEILEVVNLPRFRRAAMRTGYTPVEIAERLAGAAREPELTVGGLIRDIAGTVRFPFTQWKPLELLVPTEMLGPQPALGIISPENIAHLTRDMGSIKSVLFAGGRLHPISEVAARRGGREVTERAISPLPVDVGYRLGRLTKGMGHGATARMGASIHKDLDKILEEYPELGIRLEEGQGLADIFKMRGMTRKNQLQRFMLEVGERYGIGPQFAARTGYQVGGRGRQAFEMMSTAVRTTGLEYAGEVPGQVLAKTWEGGVFWGLLEKLGLKKMGPVRRWQDLGFIEKLKTKMGITPHRLVAKSVGGKMVHQKVPVAKLLDEMGQELNVARSFSDARAMKGYESYAFKGARQGISDWLNYHINRPTWLLQEMTGLGMRPGKTPLESLYKIGTRVALPAYLGWQMLQYAEYKTRKHLGYGPISGPMKIFLEGRATAQSMLDSSGITEKAKEIEEQFPGAIESPFSKLLVGLTGTFGGAYAGRRLGGARGAAIGLVTGLSIGLMNAAGITTPADELREMYEGEREVPVRADRWWALGRHPFSGSRIKYWKKHWFAEMMSDYKEVGLYGNRKEAWRGSWLPTPENFFLLKNVFDPYYLERSHYYDRPYPVTSPMFQDVPLVGPLAAATAGRVIKPPKYRYDYPASNWGLSPETIRGQQEAQALGLDPAPIRTPTPMTDLHLAQMTGETIHKLFDWSGMPGFMAGALKEVITGRPGFFEQEVLLAASGEMGSAQRDFYDRNLGGLLGGTELFRRFVTRPRRNERINPLGNIAPEWLPGHRSAFPGDREGYLNFHQGDPYTLLEKGEARLPGAGYEALHDLHSGLPGVYDEFDRFKILADVAPFSEAYREYKKIVQMQAESGMLSEQDLARYHRTLDQRAERLESRISGTGRRYGTGAFATDTATIAAVLSPTEFRVREMPGVTMRLAGVREPTGMESSTVGNYARLKSKMHALVGKEVQMTWGGTGVETPAIVEDVNAWAMQAGLERDRLSDLGMRAKYGAGGLKETYEQMAHFSLPAFLNYPRVKWLGVRSPVEEYEQFQAYGTADTDWAHPIRNYILPWWHSTVKTQPQQVKRAREITSYMDRLEYEKYNRLEAMAFRNRNADLAEQYRDRQRQTLTGIRLDHPNFWSDIYKALPPAERPYFNYFANLTSEEDQERVVSAVPDYMRHIYVGLWRRKMMGNEFNSPVLQRYADAAQAATTDDVDSKVAQFFTQFGAPDRNWVGWHPGVDMDAIKIKTAERAAVDIHQLGMWESQAIRHEARFPFVQGLSVGTGVGWGLRDSVAHQLFTLGYNDVDATFGSDWDADKIRMQIKRKKRKKKRYDNSPFNAGSYSPRWN